MVWAAVAFATILAVVAGLVISASGAVAHDVWSNIVRKGRDSEKEEVYVARIAAISIGAISIAIAVVGGEGLVLVGPDGFLGGEDAFFTLANPGIVSIPLGFLGCYLGTILSKDEAKAERGFDELYVRSETGLGAEVGTGVGLTGRRTAPEEEKAPTPV